MKITSKMIGAFISFLVGLVEVLRVLEAYKAGKEKDGVANVEKSDKER